MTTQPLKPCPFCGNTDLKLDDVMLNHNFVYCETCGVFGPDGESLEKTIQKWNQRAYEE